MPGTTGLEVSLRPYGATEAYDFQGWYTRSTDSANVWIGRDNRYRFQGGREYIPYFEYEFDGIKCHNGTGVIHTITLGINPWQSEIGAYGAPLIYTNQHTGEHQINIKLQNSPSALSPYGMVVPEA